MNLIEQMALSSPWWSNQKWEKSDRNLISVADSKIELRHIKKFEIKPQAIDIIRGPRQIGKTTEIKMLVRDFIKKGIKPGSIGYFTCDIISKHKDLFEMLKAFSQHLKLNKIRKGFMFLDEVTGVKNWQKAVKAYADLGLAKNIHMVMTGSSSIELKRGYERMPGRRNGGRDYLFLPVSFGRFCSLINPRKNIEERSFSKILKSKNNFEKFKEEVLITGDFYRKIFSDYVVTGGFPRAISDFKKYGETSGETTYIYQSVLFSEFEKYKKSTITLMQILGEIVADLCTSVSFNNIMKRVDVSSAKTVKEYIEMLSFSYLGLQVPCIDISRRRIYNKKNKKIYLMDPVIFKVLQDKFRLLPPDKSKLSENLVAVHLGRFFIKEWSASGILNELFYWKSAKGNEVDFVIFLENKPFGIEVKYQNIISKWDEMSIRRGIGRGLVITRDTFEYGEIPKIPIWAFLLLKME